MKSVEMIAYIWYRNWLDKKEGIAADETNKQPPMYT